MMTGRIVRSDEAVALGIALRIEEDVLSGAKVLAETIAQKGPVAIRLVKEVVDSTDRVDLDVGLSAEAGAFGLCFATQDQTEGMQAFLEKRTAKFTGH
jgi:enoyl-CoA hydratase